MEKKPDKLVPALIGGAIVGVLSAVPGLNLINCFCCAGIIVGGFFAVYFYNKNLTDDDVLTYNDGALLGILAGIFGVIFGSVLHVIIGTSIEQVFDQILKYATELPPEAEDVLLILKENSGKLLIVKIAFDLVNNVIFGLLGGILGVAILGKKKVG